MDAANTVGPKKLKTKNLPYLMGPASVWGMNDLECYTMNPFDIKPKQAQLYQLIAVN